MLKTKHNCLDMANGVHLLKTYHTRCALIRILNVLSFWNPEWFLETSEIPLEPPLAIQHMFMNDTNF